MAQKKAPARTTSAKRKTASKKSPVKKGKVTVSPVGLIVLCGSVVICCMVLLLATTIAERRPEIETVKTEEVKKLPGAQKPVETKQEVKKEVAVQKTTKTQESQGTSDTAKAPSQTQIQINTAPKVEEKKKSPEQKTPVSEAAPAKITQQKKEETNTNKTTAFDFPPAVNHAQLCILLDDGGQNLSDLQKFLALKIPVTVAVLPKLRDSVSSAQAVRASGYGELMLHQPMQAINMNVNPGPGAIKPEMTSSEIRALIQENLRQIGPVSGINNHEGSLITADALKMETVANLAHDQGIYFLDSRTNAETKIPYVSREMGYGWYERNGYFLDNEKTRSEFLKQLRKNLDIANKTGCVIMIAHVWSADYMPALIREVYPELVAKGYSFTTVGKSRGLKN